MNIDPNMVINDLLSQIQKLTADNTLLRVALQQHQAQHSHGEPAEITDNKADLPDQTK